MGQRRLLLPQKQRAQGDGGPTRPLHLVCMLPRLLESEAVRSRKCTEITIETERLLIIRSGRNPEMQWCANCQKNEQLCVEGLFPLGSPF